MNTPNFVFACLTILFTHNTFSAAGYQMDNTRIKTILNALDNDIATEQTHSFPHTLSLMDDSRTALRLRELFSLNKVAGYIAALKTGFSTDFPDSSLLTDYVNAVFHSGFSSTDRLILDFYKPLINMPNTTGIMPIFSCINAPRYVIGLYLRGARIDTETVSAAQRQLKKWPSLLATLYLLHDNKELFEPFMPKPTVESPLPFVCDSNPMIPNALTYINKYSPTIAEWIAEEKAHITAVDQQDPAYREQLKNQMHVDARIVNRPVIRDEIRFMGTGDQE